MDATPPLEEWPVLQSEVDDLEVHSWREDQFRRLGFSAREALELACSRVDLGLARSLVGAGCAPKLALRILG